VLLFFNFYSIKYFKQSKNNCKTEDKVSVIDFHTESSQKLDSSNYGTFIETDYSRDFYRYKCKNRKRIGANKIFVDIIPDKLYRIEG